MSHAIDPDTLRATIADLQARLDALPTIDRSLGSHHRHREAAEALADHLRSAYGARIHDGVWTNTIRMHGISSSGTAGLQAAFRNWLAAALRRIGSAS